MAIFGVADGFLDEREQGMGPRMDMGLGSRLPLQGARAAREGGATGGSPPPTCTCSAPLDRVWVEDGWASRPRRRPWGALRTWRLAEAAGPGSVIV